MFDCTDLTACSTAPFAAQWAHRPKRGRPRKPVLDLHMVNRDGSIAPLHRGPPRKRKTSSAAAMATSHLPPATLEAQAKAPTAYQSAITNHLTDREHCRSAYYNMSFRVLSHGRTKHHLKVLEVVYTRTHSPGCACRNNSYYRLSFYTRSLNQPCT